MWITNILPNGSQQTDWTNEPTGLEVGLYQEYYWFANAKSDSQKLPFLLRLKFWHLLYHWPTHGCVFTNCKNVVCKGKSIWKMLPSFVTQTDRSLALNVGKPSITDMHMCIHQTTRNLNLSVAQTRQSHCKRTASIFRIIFSVGAKNHWKAPPSQNHSLPGSLWVVHFMKIKIWSEPADAKSGLKPLCQIIQSEPREKIIWSEPTGMKQ